MSDTLQAIDGALTKNAKFRIPDCATFRRVLLGEEEWLVGRPSTEVDQSGDTLMSLGLDLMGESTAQSDTAMGFMDEMEEVCTKTVFFGLRTSCSPRTK